MALKTNLNKVSMKPHPKFDGVKIGYVVTKEIHPELSIILLEVSPGVEIPNHTHEKEIDSILILQGEAETFINNEWTPVKEGDIIVIGSKELHGLRAKGEVPLKAYIIHAPALW